MISLRLTTKIAKGGGTEGNLDNFPIGSYIF